jgi:hypothetical protein
MTRFEPEELFLQTIRELEERLSRAATSQDDNVRQYEALRIAALLRQLLLDESPLLVQASKRFPRVKPRFEVRAIEPPCDSSLWFVGDLLDPESFGREPAGMLIGGATMYDRALSPEEIFAHYKRGPQNQPIVKLGYSKLIACVVARAVKQTFTVKDVIRFLANMAGGVHHGEARTDKERALDELSRTYELVQLPSVHQLVFAVGRVVVLGVQPLTALLNRTP